MRICPIHGPGCYGIPEECAWIEADIQRRHAEGQCFQCGAYPPDYCERCHLIAARPAVKDGEQPRP